MSWTDLKTFSEMSWLPFNDVRFLIFFVIFIIIFAIFFFSLLKNFNNKREQKGVDLFLSMLDNSGLNSEKKDIVKMFAIVDTKYNRLVYYLWFTLEEWLSIENKKLLESFWNNELDWSLTSEKYKEFVLEYDEEYKIYWKIIKKFKWRSFFDMYFVIWVLFLIMITSIICISLFLSLFLK